jgi:hypothetical protein
MASQLDLFGGETPYGPPRMAPGVDPTLAARQARKMRNRERIVGTPATQEREFGIPGIDPDEPEFDPHQTDMTERYGIRNVYDDVIDPWGRPHDKRNAVPFGVHDSAVFRKAGKVRELPLVGPDAVTTMQGAVSDYRVGEINADQQQGSDPRFPGRELPLSVELLIDDEDGMRKRPRDVIWNGNHRVSAAAERGEMFQPFQSIKQDELPEANQVFRRDKARFADARAMKYDIGSSRMVTGNATLRQGLGRDLDDAIAARLARDTPR